ncbi:MAG: hypothetical protein LBU32_29010 [Clostridiales bacterium]|nr:hypothetical protein [Clostridiales bacterium]
MASKSLDTNKASAAKWARNMLSIGIHFEKVLAYAKTWLTEDELEQIAEDIKKEAH